MTTINVEEATVLTATVSIRTLRVGARQVTLSLFRQLQEDPVVGDDGTLRGQVWGRINYHPDKCDGGGHIHVVWQFGDELRRARVDRPCARMAPVLPREGARWLVAAVLDGWRPRAWPDPYHDEMRINFGDDLPPAVIYARDDSRVARYARDADSVGEYDQSNARRLRAELTDDFDIDNAALAREAAQSAVKDDLRAVRDYRDRYDATWEMLHAEIPQLFIAA